MKRDKDNWAIDEYAKLHLDIYRFGRQYCKRKFFKMFMQHSGRNFALLFRDWFHEHGRSKHLRSEDIYQFGRLSAGEKKFYNDWNEVMRSPSLNIIDNEAYLRYLDEQSKANKETV